jgi:GcrA cell cycle regulator
VISNHPERNAEIRRLSAEGWKNQALAEKFGVSRKRIYELIRAADAVRIPREPSQSATDEFRAKVFLLWQQGVPTGEIGERMGVSKNVITSLRKRAGWKPRGNPRLKRKQEPTPPKVRLEVGHSRVRATGELIGRTLPIAPVAPEPAVRFQPRRPAQCCWPLWGDKERPTHVYCVAQANPGKPYCTEHQTLAYVRPVRDEAA